MLFIRALRVYFFCLLTSLLAWVVKSFARGGFATAAKLQENVVDFE